MLQKQSENGMEGDDEREEENSEAEEEDEPRLKYQRMGGSVPTLLQRDAASCIAVAERMIALGTNSGSVHILDFIGNQVKEALAQSGLESSNLIIGIDFTKSNEWTRKHSFNQKSLHHIGEGF